MHTVIVALSLIVMVLLYGIIIDIISNEKILKI